MEATQEKHGPSVVKESEYAEATESYTGWCTTCKSFTRECTEPDAEGYDCPDCEQSTVVGAEQALLMNLIAFDDDETADEEEETDD
jgi:Zn finger protein HypA/HybF involved in hydrogenase expression